MKEDSLASEMDNLELLEERVRRVTEVIRGMRHEKVQLLAQLQEAQDRIRKSSETIAALQEENRRTDELSRQLRLLQEERQEIRGRVSRMLETFSSIDEMQPSGHPDN
jgi:septal ring factor EnvC (AmiA/AmiB activator)